MECQRYQLWVTIYRIFDKRLAGRREHRARDERNGLAQRCRRVDPARNLANDCAAPRRACAACRNRHGTNLIAVRIRKGMSVAASGPAIPSARYRDGTPLALS